MIARVHYAAVGPDGVVGSAGHAGPHMREAVEATHTIITEAQFALLETRGATRIRYRFQDGELHPLPAEPPAPAELARAARRQRDELLAASDPMMLSDYPLEPGRRPALLAYRQALREVPRQAGFPGAVAWPARDW